VVDECLASDQEMTSLEEPPPQASRQVIDEGIYGRLASGDCTGSEATCPASTATRDSVLPADGKFNKQWWASKTRENAFALHAF
jgi:hypothetical protein